MARIRDANVRRVEVDTAEEVAKTFNDVYRVLREQQNEIDTLRAATAKVQAYVIRPVATEVPERAGRSTKESKK